MTIASLGVIMRRIKYATPHSKIAVFRVKLDGVWNLKAVFANTVQTVRALQDEEPSLVGVYYRGSVQADARKALIRALNP